MLCLLRASFSSRSRSSPLMRYMMKRVTPTYQQANRKPYHQIFPLTALDFICGSSSSVIRCLEISSSGLGSGPCEKSLFLTTWPLKLRLPVCSLGGKMRVVSKRRNVLLKASVSLFITNFTMQSIHIRAANTHQINTYQVNKHQINTHQNGSKEAYGTDKVNKILQQY